MEDFTAALVSLTELIRQQAETANQREERLAAIVETQAAATSTAVSTNNRRDETSANRPKLPASATPAPRLSGGASLREFSTWKERLNGYNMLTGVDKLSQKEQRASPYTIVDDEWYRIIKFGLSDVTDTLYG